MAKKDAVMEQIAGANISVTQTDWHVGGTALYYEYDAMLTLDPVAYNRFAFTGRSNINYSLDFRFRLADAVFYGEQAFGRNGVSATLCGVQMLIGEHFGTNVLYRRYAKDYHALYGMAWGENPRNNNEEGFYLGWNWTPGGRWAFSSYCDIFRFPWLRYRADAPTFGRDAMLQVDYTPSRNAKIYLQTRYREREENATEPPPVSDVTNVQTVSAKMVFVHQIIEGCGIGNHLEVKRRQKEGDSGNGYFIAQDAYFSFNTFPLRVTLRYAIFDTDDYDSRIYSFENDLQYSFSIPGFYGRGTRMFLLLKYSPGKHFDIRFKYATTYYTDRDVTGSGGNEIPGNRRSEVKLQMICKF
jgi:hypothetical protein